MTGDARVLSNGGGASKSSYSSESPTANTFSARVNCSRPWVAHATQNGNVVKLQPLHSGTPTDVSIRELSMAQPGGAL